MRIQVVNSKFISTNGEVKKFTNIAFCIAEKEDILMVLSDVPNGRAIAKCFFVDVDNLYTVNQRICKITPNRAVSIMIFYFLNRNPYFLAFDDGVKQTNLKKEDVLNCPVLLPKDHEEQQKIADCLTSIDDLITAEAQKIDALKAHKKGLMQQLFPAEGETIPKLRFPEFRDAGEWEEKMLGDVCDVLNNRRKPITGSGRIKGKYPYYGASGIVDYINDYIFEEQLLLVGEDGAKRGAFESTAFVVEGKYWVNNHAHVLRSKKISNFLLENYLTMIDVAPFITGAAPPKLTLGTLKHIPIPIPPEKEQHKIADCLSSLDELITAQAQKIDALKNHKKGLMQQLFPTAKKAM